MPEEFISTPETNTERTYSNQDVIDYTSNLVPKREEIIYSIVGENIGEHNDNS